MRSTKSVKPYSQKYFTFQNFGFAVYWPAFRFGQRDERVVTNVERNAVDADVPIDVAAHLRTTKSCGPGTPMQVSSPGEAQKLRGGDGGNSRLTGEITI